MENTIRVYNDRKYNIGLVKQNGIELVVKAGAFVALTREEIEYVASLAPGLFEGEKQLRVEDRELAVKLGFVASASAPRFDEPFIIEQLSQRPAQISKWLDGINEPYLLDMIYDVASKLDLPGSKLTLLKSKLPDREFIGSDE